MNILAQSDDGGGWGNIIYLLVFLVFPALNKLGQKLRERFSTEESDESPVPTPDAEAPPVARPRRALATPAVTPPVIGKARPDLSLRRPVVEPRRPQPPVARPVIGPPASATEKQAPPPRRHRRPPAHAVPPPAPSQRRPVRERSVSPSIMAVDRRARRPTKEDSKPTERKAQDRLLPEILRPSDMRAAVILSEILRPPIGLRPPE